MSEGVEPFQFYVEPLAKGHDRTGFSSGSPALDHYFQKQARQDMEKKVAATFVLVDTNTGAIAGFYSLSATAVRLDELPSDTIKKLPRYPLVPATLLARLAVDLKYRGNRLGEFLLLDALKRSLDHSKDVGSAAVIVDAKDDARLFLPMRSIERLF